MAGLSRDEARDWWRRTVAGAGARAVILAARDASGIVGSVQLHPAWAPNQPHRADVAKLLVHRRARRRGLARALMADLEARAAASGFTLLVLDTCQGTPAEALYRGLGWTEVGVIPHFALTPDGGNCDTVFFYKEARGSGLGTRGSAEPVAIIGNEHTCEALLSLSSSDSAEPRVPSPEPRIDVAPGSLDPGRPDGLRCGHMCRNIRTLANFDPPATEDEIHASALQFVRKLSGTARPSRANEEAFNSAVEEVTAAAARLIRSLTSSAPPRNREEETAKARERSMKRFA